MIKINYAVTMLFAGLGLAAGYAHAAPQQTIPQQCQQLFQATDSIIADAEKQPGTHPQVSKIKNKLNQSKQQILEMELATQIKSCDHGLAKLNSLKQQDQDNN